MFWEQREEVLKHLTHACAVSAFVKLPDPGECTGGAVRLIDGVLEHEGRVEVCINGVWGSICGNGWNAIDGYVLCKELGFDDSGLQSRHWLVQVDCMNLLPFTCSYLFTCILISLHFFYSNLCLRLHMKIYL